MIRIDENGVVKATIECDKEELRLLNKAISCYFAESLLTEKLELSHIQQKFENRIGCIELLESEV